MKVDITQLDKEFNIDSKRKSMYLNMSNLKQQNIAWNKGKKGLQKSEKKGGNREDLSSESREIIAKKTAKFHTGRKRSEETKRKMSEARKLYHQKNPNAGTTNNIRMNEAQGKFRKDII
tara:strand:+ start:295 stop:651 length:357 start_codon:yes stop_codon:yes gene_type:complete